MSQLFNKNILLGVSGSIAAYKSAELLRLFQEAGAEVRVIMTESAMEFVGALTFQALSGFPVHRQLVDEEAEAGMGHIELARWADALVIAPASANCIATLAQGRADDLLSAISLATPAPIAIAPAMNQNMWINSATQANISTIIKREITVLGPETGEQACGDVGPGRMLQPQQICQQVAQLFQTGSLSGLKVLVSAGPTREAIDPVRYISNRSSGKMGFALANAVIEAGAKCSLIAGPVHLDTPDKVQRINVVSTAQMHQAIMDQAGEHDIFISTAAVSDYRPATAAEQKLKKTADALSLELIKNPDILSDVTQQFPKLFTVGFAAETHELEKYAQGKLEKKSLDMVAANLVSDQSGQQGFDADNNELTVYWKNAHTVESRQLPLTGKHRLARQLVQLISECYKIA